MIHQGSAGTRGAPSDMEIQLREVLALTRRMAEIIAHHTGRPLEQVARDIDRDYYMTAEEARDYGIIDDIILPRRGLCAPARARGRDRVTPGCSEVDRGIPGAPIAAGSWATSGPTHPAPAHGASGRTGGRAPLARPGGRRVR